MYRIDRHAAFPHQLPDHTPSLCRGVSGVLRLPAQRHDLKAGLADHPNHVGKRDAAVKSSAYRRFHGLLSLVEARTDPKPPKGESHFRCHRILPGSIAFPAPLGRRGSRPSLNHVGRVPRAIGARGSATSQAHLAAPDRGFVRSNPNFMPMAVTKILISSGQFWLQTRRHSSNVSGVGGFRG